MQGDSIAVMRATFHEEDGRRNGRIVITAPGGYAAVILPEKDLS